jgi:hypothetical protein
MIEDNHRINLIRDLVRRQMIQSQSHIPSSEWNKKEQALFMYSQQLLSSSMTPSVPLNDHQAIMEKLKTCLYDRKGQFEYAIKIMDELKEVNKWKIIYFLIRLEEKGRMPIKFIESNAYILKSLKINDDNSNIRNHSHGSNNSIMKQSSTSSMPLSHYPSSSSISTLTPSDMPSDRKKIELTPSAAFMEYSKTSKY